MASSRRPDTNTVDDPPRGTGAGSAATLTVTTTATVAGSTLTLTTIAAVNFGAPLGSTTSNAQHTPQDHPPPINHSTTSSPSVPPRVASTQAGASTLVPQQVLPPSPTVVTAPSPQPSYLRSHFPHPDTIRPPRTDITPEGYYVITVGQEVGIFYYWADVAERIAHVSGNVHRKYHTFRKALQMYTRAYDSNSLQVLPVPGGRFATAVKTYSPTSSAGSSQEMWGQLEDLSVHMSQVTM